MSTIKVDTVKNRSSAINLPNNFKIGGLSIIQGYTSSGSEPGSPSTGDFWWDSTNEKLYRYIDGGFKELTIAAATVPVWGGTRGLFVGGGTNSGRHNAIQYIDITTPGNGVDFGDLTGISEGGASASNQARVVHKKGIISGSGWPASYVNDMDYFAPATTAVSYTHLTLPTILRV